MTVTNGFIWNDSFSAQPTNRTEARNVENDGKNFSLVGDNCYFKQNASELHPSATGHVPFRPPIFPVHPFQSCWRLPWPRNTLAIFQVTTGCCVNWRSLRHDEVTSLSRYGIFELQLRQRKALQTASIYESWISRYLFYKKHVITVPLSRGPFVEWSTQTWFYLSARLYGRMVGLYNIISKRFLLSLSKGESELFSYVILRY